MLLSKLQRFIKKSLLHETELRNNKNNAETCQNAQAVTESMNQGLKMVEIMLEDMIDARYADDDIAAAIDRQRYTNWCSLCTQTTILRRRLIGKGIQTREKMVGVLCGTGTVVV